MTPDRPPSRRQQQAAATLEQIVLAARDTFQETGYQASTIGLITERARTAHGTFYLYFRNKEAVFARVIADATDELYREADVEWTGRPRDVLAASIHGYYQAFSIHGGLWRALLEASFQHPTIERMWIDLRRPFIDRLAQFFRLQQAAGAMRPFDPEMAAHAIGSMAEWFAFTHFVLGEPPVVAGSFEAATETLTDVWYHAMYGRVPDEAEDGAGPAEG